MKSLESVFRGVFGDAAKRAAEGTLMHENVAQQTLESVFDVDAWSYDVFTFNKALNLVGDIVNKKTEYKYSASKDILNITQRNIEKFDILYITSQEDVRKLKDLMIGKGCKMIQSDCVEISGGGVLDFSGLTVKARNITISDVTVKNGTFIGTNIGRALITIMYDARPLGAVRYGKIFDSTIKNFGELRLGTYSGYKNCKLEKVRRFSDNRAHKN